MDTSSFSALLNNIILLLALGVIYDTLGLHAIKHKLARDGLSGLLAGIIGLAVMSMSWEMQPGIFFDTRWVLLSLCGLFFGFRPTLIAVVITVSYRLYQGGSGIFVGSLVIILSSCAGLLWRCWSKKAQRPLSWLMLYLFGMQVQVIVLLCMFLMPAEIRWPIITAIAPSLLLAYPVATMVLGLILRRQRDRRAAEKALRKSQEELNRERGLLRGLVDAIPDLIFVKNTQSEYKGCNKAFEAFSNHTESEVQGKTDMELFSPEVSVLVREKDQAVLSTGLPQSYECVSAYPDGREVVLDVYKAPFYGLDGTLYGIVGISRDITDKRAADELIWQQANFDTLTGLPNRNMMQDRMAQEIKKAHRVGGMVALMFLDLDRFKEINDSLGHDMGDRLLVEAARRLSLAVRDTDTVARQGGDEFTVILGELKETGSVEKVANNILTSLAEPFLLGDEQVYVTASIGITFYPDDATEIEALLKNADQAMYAAKAAGRNRFSYFTAAMQEAALTRVQLAKDLRTALSGGQFRVDYQPIVALNTGSVYKAEALIRWQHPTLGLVSPVDFIGVAEDTGQIVDIGQWVFEYAAKQVLEWRKTIHPDFQISVNTSPVQFCEESCKPSAWIQALEALGLPGQGISVEITEGLLMDTGKVVSEKLLAFRDGNIQVSLDDFGTGYSSLAYLRRFDIDYLKIDKAFVSNLEIDSDDMVLCEAIIVMAHKLGIKVIAEGIETAEQHGLLAAAGCDYGQGYYFSRPVSAGQFARQFAESASI